MKKTIIITSLALILALGFGLKGVIAQRISQGSPNWDKDSAGADIPKYEAPKNCNLIVSDGESVQEDGIDAAKAGATVCIQPGVYEGQLKIEKSLTLVSTEGPNETTINSSGKAIGVFIKASDVAFKGFKVVGFDKMAIEAGDPHTVSAPYDISNITVTHNIVPEGIAASKPSGTRALYFAAVKQGLIENNELGAQPGDIRGYGYFTADVQKSKNIKLVNNKIEAKDIDAHGGIVISGAFGNTGHKIKGNTITGYSSADFSKAIYLSGDPGPVEDIEIEKNKIKGNAIGVSLKYADTSPITGIQVKENYFLKNELGINNANAEPVEISNNWWE